MSLIPQEKIDQANAVDLVDFLRSQGEEVIPKNVYDSDRNYRWKKHDSVVIRGNKWIRYSTGEQGYPIRFVETFYNIPFRDAVFFLIGSGAIPAPVTGSGRTEQFRLPDQDSNHDIVISYLLSRAISLDVINIFIDRGDLFQESGRFHNAVFVGRDLSGTPRYCFKRGTHDYVDRDGIVRKFRNEPSGSDKHFGFSNTGTDSRLCVFESCIDLLSFMTLFPKSRESHLLSLGGTGDDALRQYIADHPQIWTVYFCLDNDQAGQDASERLGRILPATYTVGRLVPALKDWNDVLRSETPVPAPYTLKYR